MQRLRNRELEQAQKPSKPQVWHAKQTADKGQPSANIQMAFLLPLEFRAPTDQEVYSDFDESEYEEIVAKLTVIQQAIFDKPIKHWHLKALYVKVLLMGSRSARCWWMEVLLSILCLTPLFIKLGKGPGDLIETDMMLKD